MRAHVYELEPVVQIACQYEVEVARGLFLW